MKTHEILDELAPKFVNSKINKSQWKMLGQGSSASVWQHYSDPDTVVKVVGGGFSDLAPGERAGMISFVHFCHSYKGNKKHLPNILSINIDDNEVLQIRLEKLMPINRKQIVNNLADLSYFVSDPHGAGEDIGEYRSVRQNLAIELARAGIDKNNQIKDIVATIKLLQKGAGLFSVPGMEIVLDLHERNWMMRSDGTIVAVDPWAIY